MFASVGKIERKAVRNDHIAIRPLPLIFGRPPEICGGTSSSLKWDANLRQGLIEGAKTRFVHGNVLTVTGVNLLNVSLIAVPSGVERWPPKRFGEIRC